MALKLRAKVNLPANVIGTSPIKVTKQNGIYTFTFDPTGLPDVQPLASDYVNALMIYFNKALGSLSTISLAELVGILSQTPNSRVITAAGTVTVGASDARIAINKSSPSATPIQLPPVATRTPSGIPLDIVDFAGTGGDITIAPNGTEKIMGANTPWVVKSGGSAQTGGAVRLVGDTNLNGWILK